MTQREIALQVAFRYLGQWYKWGGDDPQGFDCSGFIIECFKSAHMLPREGDWTAASLAEFFRDAPKIQAVNMLKPGHIVFWGSPPRYVHIEMVYENYGGGRVVTIGASGGGSRTVNESDAIRDNAFIKIRPVKPGWTLALDPF